MASISQTAFEQIEKILLHFPKFNLSNQTTVSRQLNDVISSSIYLMDHINLHWKRVEKVYYDQILASRRKYRNIIVEDCAADESEENLLKFLHKHSKIWNSITLYGNEFHVGTVQKILEIAGKSLVELKMELKCQDLPEIASAQLPKLQKFEYTFDDDQTSKYVMELLGRLKSLKYLSLGKCAIDEKSLQTIVGVEATELLLENCSFDCDERVGLVGNEQLEVLTITTEDNSSFRDEYVIQKIIETCPKLTTLNIEWMNIGFETSLTIAKKAKNLKNLRIDCTKFDPITLPTVEIFETFGCSIDDVIKFVRINSQLKKIICLPMMYDYTGFRKALSENPKFEVEYV